MDRYHYYLTKVASLDLESVSLNLNHLRYVENVLRYVAHVGSVLSEQNRPELETIDGINFDGLLILISDGFIWESLDHAKHYLQAVARA